MKGCYRFIKSSLTYYLFCMDVAATIIFNPLYNFTSREKQRKRVKLKS